MKCCANMTAVSCQETCSTDRSALRIAVVINLVVVIGYSVVGIVVLPVRVIRIVDNTRSRVFECSRLVGLHVLSGSG